MMRNFTQAAVECTLSCVSSSASIADLPTYLLLFSNNDKGKTIIREGLPVVCTLRNAEKLFYTVLRKCMCVFILPPLLYLCAQAVGTPSLLVVG